MTFMSSEIGLASVQSPPPTAAASFSDRKDQVIASFSPRAAAARRTRRSSFCSGVAVGVATPGVRGSGTDGTLSMPAMRITSSTMSAGPSISRRQLGAVTRNASKPSPISTGSPLPSSG